MANIDSPKGLVPVKMRNGSSWDGKFNLYYVPATYATALFIGDPIVKTGTTNTSTIEGNAAGTLPEVNKATAATANPITGVVIGFGVDANQLEKTFNPASAERLVQVVDDPNVVFEAQTSASSAVTDIGNNCLATFATAGSTASGLSGVELDSTTFAGTATHTYKVLRLVNKVNNELGTNAKLEVLINNHTDSNAVAGI